LSLYEFVVSGFRNNACVLKLKRMFFFFLWNAGSMCLDVTPTTLMNEGCEDGVGVGVGVGEGGGEEGGTHRDCLGGRGSGRGYHRGHRRGLDLVAMRRWNWAAAILVGEFRWAGSSSQQPISLFMLLIARLLSLEKVRRISA
jgi:hypothetical protein